MEFPHQLSPRPDIVTAKIVRLKEVEADFAPAIRDDNNLFFSAAAGRAIVVKK
jgi:hypothetical protein